MFRALGCLMAVGLASLSSADQFCQSKNIPATTPNDRFVVRDNGTVSDMQTALMWRVCVEGLIGEACNEGQPLQVNWAAALTHAPQLNMQGGYASYTDWRLPNVRELSTLVELQCANPAMNASIFPNAPISQVWTSSPYHFYTHYSWYVDFANGVPTYDERIKEKMVRLVRDENAKNRSPEY